MAFFKCMAGLASEYDCIVVNVSAIRMGYEEETSANARTGGFLCDLNTGEVKAGMGNSGGTLSITNYSVKVSWSGISEFTSAYAGTANVIELTSVKSSTFTANQVSTFTKTVSVSANTATAISKSHSNNGFISLICFKKG